MPSDRLPAADPPADDPADESDDPLCVEISDEQSVLQLDHDHIRHVAELVFAQESVTSADVSMAFVDNATIRDLNRRYLNHDYDTDVLSFPLSDDPDGNHPPERRRVEGEIIVSVEMAVQVAEEFRWRPHDELVLYVVHGLLHLCGFDDASSEEKQLMRSRERSVLQQVGLTPVYTETESGPSESEDSDHPPSGSRGARR